MKVVEMEEPDGSITTMDRVITPKIKSAATCPIPLCRSCQLSRAKQRKPAVAKSKAIPSEEGALSRDKYETGDFVSMDQYVVKAPGRLPSGFGKEAVHNMFHGGTIFRDAASKLIHVANQVSLGAGKTVNSKLKFEEWLWEFAYARVKHYHSDNGIFVSEDFKEACGEKEQTQSFSGVGAQHQNSEAERAIQTIMYMARSFMIHAAMHWGEDDSGDISLWPFAVDHAAWLYNRLPQRRSGITPIEFATRCKTDHKDLLRTHVWGCPVFVLDPKLQDNRKLPKWQKRARMGQFLGFSRQHSSTVALVRNLHTNYVSLQYHVVFDDNFQTVLHDGHLTEDLHRICDELFVESREVYAEEEFDDDGLLIYKPPPLDEVWLSEPERRERRRDLEEQRRRADARRKELNDRNMTRQLDRSREPVPDMVESDCESDDDDSLSGDPQHKSGGEVENIQADPWSDHPNDAVFDEDVDPDDRIAPQKLSFDDEASEEAEDIPADEGLGRSADGKSRQLKGKRAQYACYLGEKQIPPAVRRAYLQRKISRKRSQYKQRVLRRREQADALMLQAEVEVPTVEALMACPLS